MFLGQIRGTWGILIAVALVVVFSGCSSREVKGFSRMHFENEGSSAVTFLAIGTSEAELKSAENRLARPLPPRAVYSAALSRPGNYWIRAEIETDGYTIERIEGPVRVGHGVSDWRLSEVDSVPLYSVAVAYPAAARMSLSSN